MSEWREWPRDVSVGQLLWIAPLRVSAAAVTEWKPLTPLQAKVRHCAHNLLQSSTREWHTHVALRDALPI